MNFIGMDIHKLFTYTVVKDGDPDCEWNPSEGCRPNK